MTKLIHIDVSRLEQMIQLPADLDRKAKVQQQKQAIYQFRNQLLSQHMQREIQNADLSKTEYGKPYLEQFPQVTFNHSHSHKHYALAYSDTVKQVGIDIEDLDRKVRFEALAQHAFHPDELKHWAEMEYSEEFWFRVWTTKEAVLKASGLGIRLSLNELNTQVHPIQHGGMCQHAMLGSFAYQNYHLGQTMLTVAWQAELSCHGFQWPQIQLIQH
ncbi:4'-phosphopantetheinyl transferase family protein [Acinetobacter sp. ANC 4910]|uniref:4'-phosphopantetheinyl transferase family protein n=1 Tax=Acinetobacter sp. ANC 4910 TaxID=2529850 RepID=UPI001D17EC9A|nr:4'-phosphopantetheinyl transferase superfamily protein [Acinetobacter sp. ANC 4910]